ncbi:MAG TPA: methionyl-tRNA formyltransferase, partial [Chthoniobacterales bacterium]
MRVVFIGTGAIGVPALRALLHSTEHELVGVVTGQDKPVGRDQRIEASPIGGARPPGVPLLQPARIKDPEAIAQMRALKPDVIIVVAYGQILSRNTLEIASVACLNLHASLLPRWRGAAPIQAAIAAGDRETGITVMFMDPGLDTGDILLQRKIDILPNDTGGTLHDRLAQVAPEALLESLRLLASGNAPRE